MLFEPIELYQGYGIFLRAGAFFFFDTLFLKSGTHYGAYSC